MNVKTNSGVVFNTRAWNCVSLTYYTEYWICKVLGYLFSKSETDVIFGGLVLYPVLVWFLKQRPTQKGAPTQNLGAPTYYFDRGARIPRVPFGSANAKFTLSLPITMADRGFSRRGEGAPTGDFGAKTYYLARFLPKTACKWKKLNGGRASLLLPPWIRQLIA